MNDVKKVNDYKKVEFAIEENPEKEIEVKFQFDRNPFAKSVNKSE